MTAADIPPPSYARNLKAIGRTDQGGRPDAVHGGQCAPAWEHLTSDDQAWMTWEYADGAIAQLFGSFAVDDLSSDPVNFGIKALGTGGSAALNWPLVCASVIQMLSRLLRASSRSM